jgi:hypothetical protein
MKAGCLFSCSKASGGSQIQPFTRHGIPLLRLLSRQKTSHLLLRAGHRKTDMGIVKAVRDNLCPEDFLARSRLVDVYAVLSHAEQAVELVMTGYASSLGW